MFLLLTKEIIFTGAVATCRRDLFDFIHGVSNFEAWILVAHGFLNFRVPGCIHIRCFVIRSPYIVSLLYISVTTFNSLSLRESPHFIFLPLDMYWIQIKLQWAVFPLLFLLLGVGGSFITSHLSVRTFIPRPPVGPLKIE